MSIEKNFDIPFISNLALREKQIQQNYRPIIAVHKWFARRPGTLFRGLILSEFSRKPLHDAFYGANNLNGIIIADPFMGGGTPLIEANRLGCDIVGFDINPMAHWIVSREIEHLDLNAYRAASSHITETLQHRIGSLYRTSCLKCGSAGAHVKYFLWVKQRDCDRCGTRFDLFPGHLVAENRRHPKNVFVCASCGELTETDDRKHPGPCRSCGKELMTTGPARRNRCTCPSCKTENSYPVSVKGPPHHRMFAMEYHCPHCKAHHTGRFFKKPDAADLERYAEATARFSQLVPCFVPEEGIPPGDETNRLHRWGYGRYREMFNDRQLLGLELLCCAIDAIPEERIRNALATNLSDLLRYQNMLCRYDTMALKSLDIFSVHGFPVGLVQCESNLLGISSGAGTNIGSGGWSNIVEKYLKAKAYCDNPFEIRHEGSRKIKVPVNGEWIGDRNNGNRRRVLLNCRSATDADIPPGSLDAVFTDPPYFGNVQYAELMDFCYTWLRRLAKNDAFERPSTRDENELTGNVTMERGIDHFAEGLSTVFQRMAQALKPGAPLAFTYHHNRLDAYVPLAVAILDAGLVCSAALPCPAEMGASIHISGTASSVVDTVFVCRSTGTIPRRWIVNTPDDVVELVLNDLTNLRAGGLKPSSGDARCIGFGHLIRLAVWRLRSGWNANRPVMKKIQLVTDDLRAFGPLDMDQLPLFDEPRDESLARQVLVAEPSSVYGAENDDLSF